MNELIKKFGKKCRKCDNKSTHIFRSKKGGNNISYCDEHSKDKDPDQELFASVIVRYHNIRYTYLNWEQKIRKDKNLREFHDDLKRQEEQNI